MFTCKTLSTHAKKVVCLNVTHSLKLLLIPLLCDANMHELSITTYVYELLCASHGVKCKRYVLQRAEL